MACELIQRLLECEKAELALLLDVVGDKIEEECDGDMPERCQRVIRRVLNDIMWPGKD